MGTERLKQYYNERHAEDLDVDELDLVPASIRRPTHRVEAAFQVLRNRLPAGASVLEIGAGDGRLPESLRHAGVDFSTYTLMELSDVRLDGMRRHLSHDSYRFLLGDVENATEYVQEPVDVVVMVALIEHLVDPLGAMQQLRKVLKPGGFAYIDTPNIAKWTRRVRLLAGRFPATAGINEGLTTFEHAPAMLYDGGHLHYFTYRSLELMLKERCDFEKIERHSYFCGPFKLPVVLGHSLARAWPAMFGEIAVTAYV